MTDEQKAEAGVGQTTPPVDETQVGVIEPGKNAAVSPAKEGPVPVVEHTRTPPGGAGATVPVVDHTRSEPRAAGGPGSGFFGHAGRPGEVGGSASDSSGERSNNQDGRADQILGSWAAGSGSYYQRLRNPKDGPGKEMTRFLQTLPVFKGTIYRGLDLRPSDIDRLLKSGQMKVGLHSSCSKSQSVASGFAGGGAGRSEVLLEIRGVKGYDFAHANQRERGEREVILPAGTRLKLESYTSNRSKMEEMFGKRVAAEDLRYKIVLKAA